MKANVRKVTLSILGLMAAYGVVAHTDQEMIAMGRRMVCEVLDEHCCEVGDIPEEVDWVFWTIDGFFNHFVTNGWTRAMCEASFNRYMDSVSTNNMLAFSEEDRRIAKGALGQCIDMWYTNALDSIRAYALNTTVVDRISAISVAVRFGGADEAATSFIEAIITNSTQFAYEDISMAIPIYCDKLLAVNTNDVEAISTRDRVARLFYANRLGWRDGTSLDNLFVAAISGYDYSSNRLSYANHILSWTTNSEWRAMHDHFVSITNQLLNAAQPLPVVDGL